MALMAEILDELSRLTDRQPEALAHLMRTLRTANLVETGRRGVTSQVTAKSAANLLIACLSGVQPVEAPRLVEVISGLRPLRRGGIGRGYFPTLELASHCETFGAALTLLLEQAPCCKVQASACLLLMFGKIDPSQMIKGDIDLLFSLEIMVQRRPAPYACMTLRSPNGVGIEVTDFTVEWTVNSEKLMSGYYAPELKAQRGLRTQTSITHREIFRFGDLLAADSTEEKTHETARVEREAVEEDRGHAADPAEGGTGKPRSIGYGESGLRLSQSRDPVS
jgi:hypothetical protein